MLAIRREICHSLALELGKMFMPTIVEAIGTSYGNIQREEFRCIE